MKRIYSTPAHGELQMIGDELRRAGIACFIRNELMTGLAQSVPLTESTPELWVQDDRDEAKAREVLKDLRSEPAGGAENWGCPKCGEKSEAQFTSCWKCGEPRIAK